MMLMKQKTTMYTEARFRLEQSSDIYKFAFIHMYTDDPEPATQTSGCLLFSSLSEQISKKNLEAYCDILGESITVKSIELLENGRAKAEISGITIEGIAKWAYTCMD